MATRRLVPLLVLIASLVSATAAYAEPGSPDWCKVVTTPNTLRAAGEIGNKLFVNRCVGGCEVTVVSTMTDSRTNTSVLPYYNDIPEGTVFNMAEVTISDEVWNEAMSCISEIMRPFDVVVTDTDPGSSEFHLEVMLTTKNSEIGDIEPEGGINLGVSQMSADCSPIANAVVFIFAETIVNDPREICETIVHEAGHSFGLEHIYACKDPMSYEQSGDPASCDYKFFRNEGLRCGAQTATEWWTEADCRCTGSVQNTHFKLENVFGSGAGAYPPEVAILSPEDGTTVSSSFRVYATAADIRGLDRIEFWVNGWKWLEQVASYGNEQYSFGSPSNLPDGYLDIDVIAYNDLDVAGTQSITLLKGAPCTSPSTCLDGQECSDGRCAWPAPAVAFGELCVRDQDCISGTCESYEGEARCTDSCFPTVADQCINYDEMECVGSGTNGLCWPAGSGGGGCCSVDDRGGMPWLITLFTALMLYAGGRRRRRHA